MKDYYINSIWATAASFLTLVATHYATIDLPSLVMMATTVICSGFLKDLCSVELFQADITWWLFFTGAKNCRRNSVEGKDWRDAVGGAPVRSRHAMGSNISQHSAKGLKGRRARSSGDLCNGDTKSQTESSVCGSVVGDVMGWNRSLPNHLDGNRHLADYSRVNNNYGEFGTYNRSHPKGGRGLRYRVSKSGE